MESNCKGRISQIIGAVIDVTFDDETTLPDIYDALSVKRPDGTDIILECQQDIGENTMRTIAMDSTDGLQRGMEVVSLGGPISMPVGENINGRLFNVIGQTIDGIVPIQSALLTELLPTIVRTVTIHDPKGRE